MADEIPSQIRPIVTLSEAKGRGLKRYFTGKPCKHGHIVERITVNGTCAECAAACLAEFWQVNKTEIKARRRVRAAIRRSLRPEKPRVCKNGHPKPYRGPCKICGRAARNRWHRENRDKVNAGERRRRRAKTLDVVGSRSWRAAHPELAKQITAQRNAETLRKWRLNNNEKRRAWRRKWIENNPEEHRLSQIRWIKANPDSLRAFRAARRARVRNAKGGYTASDVAALYEKQGGKCVYCSVRLGKKYDVDHIVPLARGGSNWPSNLQLCCPRCNRRKHALSHEDFLNRCFDLCQSDQIMFLNKEP